MQWSDKKAYKETLLRLGGLFKNNFQVFVAHKIGKDDKLTDEILAAGPNFWGWCWKRIKKYLQKKDGTKLMEI